MVQRLVALPLLLVCLLLLPLPAAAAFDAREADIDKDGLVTLEDAQQLARDLATLAAPWRGDINGDAYVRGDDLQLLLALLLAESMPGDPRVTDDLVNQLIQELMTGQIPPYVVSGAEGSATAADPQADGPAEPGSTTGETTLTNKEPETDLQAAISALRSHRAARTIQALQKFCDGLQTPRKPEETGEKEGATK